MLVNPNHCHIESKNMFFPSGLQTVAFDVDVLTTQNMSWLKKWDKICPLLKKKLSFIAEHHPPSTIKRVIFVDELTAGSTVQNQGTQLTINIELLDYALQKLTWLEYLDVIFIEAIVANPVTE